MSSYAPDATLEPMALPLPLLAGALKLGVEWRSKGVAPVQACKALLELAGCAAVAAKVTDEQFEHYAREALGLAKELGE